jgi:hypothetical protein
MKIYKRLLCIVTALTVTSICGGCASNSSSYENVYDSYCKALVSSDGQKIVDMCPDSYIDFLCENLYIEESDIVGAVNDYIFNNTDDIFEYADYDSYEFINASEPEEDFFNDSPSSIIYERQYPNIFGFVDYSRKLHYEYDVDYDSAASDASELWSQIIDTIPEYLESDTENCLSIKVNFKVDGEVEYAYCYGIDDKWYPEDLFEFVNESLEDLDYGDSEYPEENKPTEFQKSDSNYGSLYSVTRELYNSYKRLYG